MRPARAWETCVHRALYARRAGRIIAGSEREEAPMTLDLIIRGGANVYPLEVERVLATHPDVSKAAVYPIPDDRLGQRVAAVVESHRPEPDFDAITALCRRELASYKVPEIWTRVDALPVNAMGKIQRAGLAEFVAAHGVTEQRVTERRDAGRA